jgi:cell division protein ZapA
MDHTRVVYVDIGGQRYAIRSHLEQAYIAELAAVVDAKMQLAARESPQGDSLKIAVLAALNIADEWFRARDEDTARRTSLSHRAEELERMLDLALASAEPEAADPGSSLARTAGSF